MQPALVEDVDAFVLHIEHTHISLGMDTRSMLCTFFPCFSRGTTIENRVIHQDITRLADCTVPGLGSSHKLCQIFGNPGLGCG